MVEPTSKLAKFFRVTGVALVLLLVLALWARSLALGRTEVNRYLFTSGVTDIVRGTNPWRMTEKLSFTLSPYPYSLGGIVKFYVKTAQERGWQILSGRDPTGRGPNGPAFNEHEHLIKASKNGQTLTINIERLEWPRVSIAIIYDK